MFALVGRPGTSFNCQMAVARGLAATAAALCFSSPWASAYDNGFAPLVHSPPRGWATWCTDDYCGLLDLCFESEIHSIADALVASGLRDKGYSLVLLDDCWSATTRAADGQLQPDPARFPSGIPALVQYVQSRGLYLGIYTCAGTETCKYGRPGSWGHYAQDAATLTGWGVRYIKADNCHTGGQGAPHQYYANFSAAINATGIPVAFASCEWGQDDVAAWGPAVTQVYRINPDHLPLWRFNGSMGGQGTADIIEVMADPATVQGLAPLSFPDPDFLMTGLWPLSDIESETEFAIWSLTGSPLVVATDVRNMSAWKAGLLGNTDALAINADPGFAKAVRLRADAATGAQLWRRSLASGEAAVVLYNAGDAAPLNMSVTWAELGMPWPANAAVDVYDVWAQATVATSVPGGWTARNVPPHGSAYLRLAVSAAAAGLELEAASS